uniref:FHA domain-containing protein n=1 Tax=Suricata suricatta TaxID=37032 RepID=A0A673SUV5_SURSU
MEDTQAINWEVEEEEETEIPSESLGCSMEPVGRLHIFSSAHGPEKDFPLYLGKNMVGRMPDCSVTLPFSSISKQHAVIEILAWDKAPVLQDCGSLNVPSRECPPALCCPGPSNYRRDTQGTGRNSTPGTPVGGLGGGSRFSFGKVCGERIKDLPFSCSGSRE